MEEQVGNALKEVENSSTEFKSELKDLYITHVVEYDISKENKKGRNTLLVYVPYPCY